MDKDWIFRTDEYICDLRMVGVLVRDGKLLVQPVYRSGEAEMWYHRA